MELQQILSKMEADGWEISDDFKTAHGHFLQYFLETVEEALHQPPVMVRSEQFRAFKQFLQSEYHLPVSNRMVDEFEQKQSS